MDSSILQQLGNSSRKIIFAFDVASTRFTYLSRAAESLFAGDLHIFLQQPYTLPDVVHPEDSMVVTNCFNNLLQGKPINTQFRLQLPGLSTKVICAEAAPLYDETGSLSGVTGIAEDITDRAEHTAYLLEYAQKKDTALEILAHDLRGPISIIQSVSGALETDHQRQNYSELTNYTHFIGKACETCISLILDILSEEHLKSPGIVVNKQRIDLVEKVRDVAEMFAMNKSIKQKITLIAPAKVFADVDVIKLDQILNNLISNSIKFTKPDGTITLALEEEEHSVLLKITDNGIGIPQDMQPYLFDKYTRASRTGLHGEQARGIGLSIIRDLVEVQGGKIWCESKEGEGSTFSIRLPNQT
ncbi:PAS domain-containing sensor histidine kinase [Botryobacter ruber]|uniref:PAS domain-containing sensor histidine kinase n=1 Tax=Botryobacter ruber TaxID=2171629 RepID=UPI000E0C91AA|nr:PAS domain-containing sensor histidine kinase [Botryobacter ruber]